MSQTSTPSDAVKRLFEQYGDEVYQYIRLALGSPADAEDLLQDVFLEVLRAWPRFERRSSEGTWLWSIVRHKIADRVRERQRHVIEPISSVADRGFSTASESDTRLDLERYLRQLPLAQRQVFILRIIQDKRASEVSQRLSWSDIKVRVTLHRALKALGRMMQEKRSTNGEEGATP